MSTHTNTSTKFNVKNAEGQTLMPTNLPNLEMAEAGARRAAKATGQPHTVEMTQHTFGQGTTTTTVYIAG